MSVSLFTYYSLSLSLSLSLSHTPTLCLCLSWLQDTDAVVRKTLARTLRSHAHGHGAALMFTGGKFIQTKVQALLDRIIG